MRHLSQTSSPRRRDSQRTKPALLMAMARAHGLQWRRGMNTTRLCTAIQKEMRQDRLALLERFGQIFAERPAGDFGGDNAYFTGDGVYLYLAHPCPDSPILHQGLDQLGLPIEE